MRRLFFLCLLLTTLCTSARAQGRAQPGNPATNADQPLQQQFDEMVRGGWRYQGNRTIRQEYLETFMAHVADSLAMKNERIGELREEVSTRDARIGELQTELGDRENSIASLSEEKDNMSLLGFPVGKATYSLILWGLVIALGAFLLFALSRTRYAVASSSELARDNEKLTAELEKSRKRRLEVEQNLRRKLQDEINKRGTNA